MVRTLVAYNTGVLTSEQRERLCVVLVATRNPLNIGAAARAMSNFDFLRLRLVNPYAPSFREARSAVGAEPLLAAAEVHTSVAGAVADCALVVGTTAARDRELHQPLRGLAEAARLIRGRLRTGRVALLFGSEKRGLSNADLSHCQWVLRIPTRAERGSMNLGQAVAVSLYELAREGRAAPADKLPPAAAEQAERITGLLLEALRASGYVKPRAASAEEKLRRMVRRLHLPADDAEVWTGMLRKVLWRLKQ